MTTIRSDTIRRHATSFPKLLAAGAALALTLLVAPGMQALQAQQVQGQPSLHRPGSLHSTSQLPGPLQKVLNGRWQVPNGSWPVLPPYNGNGRSGDDRAGNGSRRDADDQGGYHNQGDYSNQGGYGNRGGYDRQQGGDDQRGYDQGYDRSGYGNQGGYQGQGGSNQRDSDDQSYNQRPYGQGTLHQRSNDQQRGWGQRGYGRRGQ
jgi:hypothetical protein